MDSAKIRVLAGVGGVLLGFAAIASIVLALGIALSSVVGAAWAALICALVLGALACAGVYLFVQPEQTHETALAHSFPTSGQDAIQDALVDMPMQALVDIVDKRPLASVAVSVAAGFLVMEQPEAVRKQLRRALSGLI